MNIENLNSFIKFGYFLDYNNPDYKIYIPKKKNEEIAKLGLNDLINIGAQKFSFAINNQFVNGKKHLVPLSGGLDSRAILGQLLKNTSAENISTFTFGTPGTFDYKIGNKLAKKIGTKHTNINLNKYDYSDIELINISERINHQTTLYYHPPISLLDKMYADNVIWSGAVIDVYFGRHYHKNKSHVLNEAKNNFINENLSSSLPYSNNDIKFSDLIDYDANDQSGFPIEHQLDLLNRQLKYILPHVLIKGFDYRVLINDHDLVKFSFDIDYKYIEKQFLYKRIFLSLYPELFKYPIKYHYGTSLLANSFSIKTNKIITKVRQRLNKNFPVIANPMTNYRDFSWDLKNDEKLKKLVYSSLMDLKGRKIVDWIDIDKIWNQHIKYNIDTSREIIILSSLEFHLKAGKII